MSASCTVTRSTALSHGHLSPFCILRSLLGQQTVLCFNSCHSLSDTHCPRKGAEEPSNSMSKTVFLCDGNNLFKPISKMRRILKTNLTLAVKNYSAWLEFLSEQYLQPVKSFLLESFNSENFIPCAFMLYTLEGEGSRQRSGHIETGIRKCAHLSSSSLYTTV